jgi:hypothetical protein
VSLPGPTLVLEGEDEVVAHAARLLGSLGATVEAHTVPGLPAIARWARCGAMALTGDADGPPLAGPAEVPARMQGAALAAGVLVAAHPALKVALPLDGAGLLGERAALAGLERAGQISAGRASRLFAAGDGWVAVTLARPSDFESLPALLGQHAGDDPWTGVGRWVRARPAAEVVQGAQLLGLAASALPATAPQPEAPWRITTFNPGTATGRPPLVVDLTSLWAGPLCAGLLGEAGARVVKVESERRPDGARRGTPAFFDLLNAGKEGMMLPLGTPAGRDQLLELISEADAVIESARPRVMAQWGIDVESLLARRDNLVWVSITGYGRAGATANWVAFGDDAAVAAGLVARAPDGTPRFCADAAADPIAGLHAAVAALAALLRGGSQLIDVSLRDAAAFVSGDGRPPPGRASATEGGAWAAELDGQRWPVATPTARPGRSAGPALGGAARARR